MSWEDTAEMQEREKRKQREAKASPQQDAVHSEWRTSMTG